MKKLLICLAATAAVWSAQAQSGDFTGFSAGGNLAMNAGGVASSTSDGFKNDIGSQQSIGIGAFANYGLSLGRGSVLALGLDYSLSDVKVQEFQDGTNNQTLKIQNIWSLSIAPGMMISDKTLAYFKLGFENGKTAISGSVAKESSKNINGNSWGFGMKSFFNKDTYLQIEAKQTNFGSMQFDGVASDLKFRATTGSVGVGFMF